METTRVALPPAVKWAIGLLVARVAWAVLGLAPHVWPLSPVILELLLDVGIDLALVRGLATRQTWSWGGAMIWASYLTAEWMISAVRLLAGGGPFKLGSLSAQSQLIWGARSLIEAGGAAAVVLLLLTRPAREALGMNRKAERAEPYPFAAAAEESRNSPRP